MKETGRRVAARYLDDEYLTSMTLCRLLRIEKCMHSTGCTRACDTSLSDSLCLSLRLPFLSGSRVTALREVS